MATNNYFPAKSESVPMIYAYEDKYDPQLKGLLKVGYTTVGVQQRVRQQYNIVRPGRTSIPHTGGGECHAARWVHVYGP